MAEDRKKVKRMVYSTKIINQLLKERDEGYEIPYDAFYQRDPDLRAPDLPFEMTAAEVEEYQKCYDDPEYFISHYCKFETDKGRALVQLRPFQKKAIKTVTDEVYLEDLDEMGPKNRNIIWMASRQVGKCHLMSSLVSLKINNLSFANKNTDYVDVPIGELFHKYKPKTFLTKLKLFLYKIYNKI